MPRTAIVLLGLAVAAIDAAPASADPDSRGQQIGEALAATAVGGFDLT